MKIGRYWAQQTVEGQHRHGLPARFTWGGSTTSQAEAEQMALDNARRVAEAAAREPVAKPHLSAYASVQKRHPRGPWVSPVEDGRCQGCHLKVSGQTVSALRHPEAPVTCDQCGRLVYAE